VLTQADDFADHGHDGRLETAGPSDDVGQRPDPHLLRFGRPPADQRDRRFGWPAVGEQRANYVRERADGHQDDERVDGCREPRPVDGVAALRRILVARQHSEGRGHSAVGDGNSRIGWHGDGGADARHHLEGDARLGQRERFLTAPTEHEGIAALEPDD